MAFTVSGKYKLEISVNNKPLDSSKNILEEMIIHENIHQTLPTVDLVLVNDSSLIESNPLLDGSLIDIDLTIFGSGAIKEENLRLECVLWGYQAVELSEGIQITLNCVMSAPDFFNSKIESINGSSFEVFSLMATRSKMNLIADPSVDKQVWIRSGIRGSLWLNQVNNHSWSSPTSAFVHVVSRHRDLLRYNLDERSERKAAWIFQPERETFNAALTSDIVIYKYPQFKSNSGLLNSLFGYGRELSTFDVDQGETVKHAPSAFNKRTNFMNVNSNRETPQKHDLLGFGNSLNVLENYYLAYNQNTRLKSFYSVNIDVLSDFPRDVKILDRVTLQMNNEAAKTTRKTYAGEYFVEKISTVVDTGNVIRRFSLVREGYNSEAQVSTSAK